MALQSAMVPALESRRGAPSQHQVNALGAPEAPLNQPVVAPSRPKEPSSWRDYRPPRDTRSISAFTMRSTSPGRLSSSQDFSIGRSISLTRSSRVRALLLSTVWASVLKADSTADTVERDNICCGAGASLSKGGGSNAGRRCIALAAAISLNSRSSCGSTFLNEGCGGGGSG